MRKLPYPPKSFGSAYHTGVLFACLVSMVIFLFDKPANMAYAYGAAGGLAVVMFTVIQWYEWAVEKQNREH